MKLLNPITLLATFLVGLVGFSGTVVAQDGLAPRVPAKTLESLTLQIETEVIIERGSEIAPQPQLPWNQLDTSINLKQEADSGAWEVQDNYKGREYRFSYKFIYGGLRIAQETIRYKTERSEVNWTKLEQDVDKELGGLRDRFGISIIDISRGGRLDVNSGEGMLPGSVGKLPVVILALIDIQNGKADWDTTYQVRDDLKHTNWDPIGKLPAGTEVTIEELMFSTINISNNSAMYHLRGWLGGPDVVHHRTVDELKSTDFHDAPNHIAKSGQVSRVLRDLYRGKILEPEYYDYLIDLMINPVESLRDGIPSVVESETVAVANKVGFLFGNGLNAYNDVAIVFGENTDYVIVVLDNQVDRFVAREKVRNIARLAHAALDQW